VVLALGESNNGRLKQIKSSPVVRQDHTEIYGVLNLLHRLMPLRRFNYTHIFTLSTLFLNKLIVSYFICNWSAKQSSGLRVHHRIFGLGKDALGVPDVERI
jgi:hypothetical protein